MFLPGIAPYDLAPDIGRAYRRAHLEQLLRHHRAGCPAYARLADDWGAQQWVGDAEDYPFLPVTLFKEYDLRSTTNAVISLQSSSTTSDRPSRIAVDQATRKRQSVSANKILADFLGDQRRPYIVFDTAETVRGADALSARGAAILGLAHLASELHFVARKEGGEMVLDPPSLAEALRTIGDQPFIAYGFTYMLYQIHERWDTAAMPVTAHPDSMFLHSGGWKRLAHLAVDKQRLNDTVAGVWGIPSANVLDFYGVVEQAGVPYPDCARGRKHVPYWADVIVRRADTLRPAAVGEPGLLQLLSCLPLSAPNHSVVTEDIGELVLLDGCECGRRGKAFVFRGRAPRAETRGCSDVPRS
jgi:hypothetical protein